MTMAETRDIARDTPRDITRDEGRAIVRRILETGGKPKAADLPADHGMSERWWRDRIREVDGTRAVPLRAVPANGGTAARAEPAAQRHTAPVPAVPQAHKKAARGKATAQTSTSVRYVTNAAVAIVSLVAAATSYSHMHALALEAGESELVAFVLPLSVDGLVVAATMTILSARGKAGALPWLALFLGLGASLAANVGAAEPTVVGRLVAAWPPVALALSFDMLLRQNRGER